MAFWLLVSVVIKWREASVLALRQSIAMHSTYSWRLTLLVAIWLHIKHLHSGDLGSHAESEPDHIYSSVPRKSISLLL